MTEKSDSQTAFFTREDGHKMVLQGAKYIRTITELASLGWDFFVFACNEEADKVVDKYMLPPNTKHYDN